MAKVLVTEGHLNNIAEAIRSKNGASTTYRPGDMAAAIQALDTSGIHPTGTKQITENGTHDVTQYASADVNVQPTLQSKTVTQNGTVTPDTGYDGLSSVVVNVSGGGLTPVAIEPTVYASSYISSSGRLYVNNASYPDSSIIVIPLDQYAGKLIHIQNDGDVNYYDLYGRIATNQGPLIFTSRKSTQGELIVYANDYRAYSEGLYLTYQFTSTAQNPPIVTVYDVNI